MTELTQLFLLSIIIAFCSAVCGFIYIRILQQPEHILGGWHSWLRKVFKEDKRYAQGKHEHPLFTILAGCELCNSGQIATWSYLWLAIYFNFYSTPINSSIIIAIMFHIFTICASIITVLTIKHLHDK